MGIMFVTSTHLALPPFLLPSPLPPVTELLSIMSLKGMSKKEQHQVLVACGLDYTLASSAAASETGPSPPTSSLHPSPGPAHHAYSHVGVVQNLSLDAAKQVAGKGLKVVSEEMRRAFKG